MKNWTKRHLESCLLVLDLNIQELYFFLNETMIHNIIYLYKFYTVWMKLICVLEKEKENCMFGGVGLCSIFFQSKLEGTSMMKPGSYIFGEPLEFRFNFVITFSYMFLLLVVYLIC